MHTPHTGVAYYEVLCVSSQCVLRTQSICVLRKLRTHTLSVPCAKHTQLDVFMCVCIAHCTRKYELMCMCAFAHRANNQNIYFIYCE